MYHIVCLIGLLVVATPLYAEEREPVPDGEPGLEDESFDQTVTIIKRHEETIEEYRVNGQLYLVKVTPTKGPSYYLMDTDGDGSLDARRNELDPRMLVPHWVILRW